MKLILAFILILISFQSAFAQSNPDDRRKELVAIINEELGEITRLNRQIGSSNPKLLVRMAELLLEKARIVKEIENSKFLSISPEERLTIDKKDFFSESNQYFVQAQKTCYYVLKRFKKINFKADIFYILAYNAKEFNDLPRSKKYFMMAYKSSKNGSAINNKSKLALADVFYNERNYRKAIEFYEGPLKDKSEKWWTKDAYNLAWCYYRLKKYDKATSLMKEVHTLSKSQNYVDMSPEAERDLAFFYSEIGKPDEAVAFYKKAGLSTAKNMVKIGKYLLSQGRYAAAEKMLTQAKQYQLDESEAIEVDISLLSLYERFGKIDRHLQASKRLMEAYKKGLLNNEQKEVLLYQIQTASANLQRQVTQKTYRNVKRVNQQKMRYAADYFRLLSELNQKNTYKFMLLVGETYYAGENYEEALEFYNKSYEGAVESNDREFQNRAVEGMMASLGKSGVSEKTKDQYLAMTYSHYLKLNPTGKKSSLVAQRLFNLNFDKGNLEESEKVLIYYKNHFPEDPGTQEAMLAKIMEYHKTKNNKEQLISWAKRIKAGEFKVSDKYAKTLGALIFTMQFENVEKAATKGDKVNALKGYMYIYKDASSSKDAKKNAAYNVAVLFYELGNAKFTYEWTKQALNLMSASDVEKFQDTLLIISSDFFGRRMLDQSIEINDLILEKVCSSKSRLKNSFFKNNFVMLLAQKRSEKAKELIKKASQCSISNDYIIEAKTDLAEFYSEEGMWDSLSSYVSEIDSDSKVWPQLIRPLFGLYLAYEKNALKDKSKDAVKKIMSYYSKSKRLKLSFPLEALDIVAHFKIKRLNYEIKKLTDIKLSFPEKVFNDALKRKFKQLDTITTYGLDILSIGSGVGIVRVYKYFIETYTSVINEIKNFKPDGKSPEYVESFKKSMAAIVIPLDKKVSEFKSEAIRQINRDEILSKDNNYFTNNLRAPLTVEYAHPKAGLIMDRGGR